MKKKLADEFGWCFRPWREGEGDCAGSLESIDRSIGTGLGMSFGNIGRWEVCEDMRNFIHKVDVLKTSEMPDVNSRKKKKWGLLVQFFHPRCTDIYCIRYSTGGGPVGHSASTNPDLRNEDRQPTSDTHNQLCATAAS